jgi:hypothetical protein
VPPKRERERFQTAKLLDKKVKVPCHWLGGSILDMTPKSRKQEQTLHQTREVLKTKETKRSKNTLDEKVCKLFICPRFVPNMHKKL